MGEGQWRRSGAGRKGQQQQGRKKGGFGVRKGLPAASANGSLCCSSPMSCVLSWARHFQHYPLESMFTSDWMDWTLIDHKSFISLERQIPYLSATCNFRGAWILSHKELGRQGKPRRWLHDDNIMNKLQDYTLQAFIDVFQVSLSLGVPHFHNTSGQTSFIRIRENGQMLESWALL